MLGYFTDLLWCLSKSWEISQFWISSGDHKCLYKISQQYIQQLLRYFSLDQSGGLTNSPIDIAIPRTMQLAWLKKQFFPQQIWSYRTGNQTKLLFLIVHCPYKEKGKSFSGLTVVPQRKMLDTGWKRIHEEWEVCTGRINSHEWHQALSSPPCLLDYRGQRPHNIG